MALRIADFELRIRTAEMRKFEIRNSKFEIP